MTVQDAIRTAHQALKKAVPSQRREAHKSDGTLGAAFREAMRIVDAQRAAGVPLTERLQGLEGVLRSVWPSVRAWKYVCQECDDTGLRMSTCPGDATCFRHKAHLPHDFGTPCWCSRGVRFQVKAKPDPSDFQAAGRTSRPSRVGR